MLFDFALLADFLAGFFTAFFLATLFLATLFRVEAFLATGFRVFFVAFFAVLVAIFLTVFFACFPAFFTKRLARFFTAAALLARTREALRACFVFGLLEAFFLGVATTISFIAQTGWPEMGWRTDAHRVASASIPNTEKTSGFRSRL